MTGLWTSPRRNHLYRLHGVYRSTSSRNYSVVVLDRSRRTQIGAALPRATRSQGRNKPQVHTDLPTSKPEARMPTKPVCMPAVGVVLDVHCMSSSPSKIPQQVHHQAKADKDKGLLRIRSEPYAPSLSHYPSLSFFSYTSFAGIIPSGWLGGKVLRPHPPF